MSGNKNVAVAIVEDISIMKMDADSLGEALSDNLGGESLSAFDLDRIKVPAGGATTWEYETIDGIVSERELKGIIIHKATNRTYWPVGMDEGGGGTPPDCSSADGVIGVGDPGGSCASCPHNQFGSGKNGRGKSCKESTMLFILQGNALLPRVVSVPPSSLRGMKKYMLRLASAGTPFWKALTMLTLNKVQNPDGIDYAEIVATKKETIPCEKAAVIKAYRENLMPSLDKAASDIATGTDEPPVQHNDIQAPPADEVPF